MNLQQRPVPTGRMTAVMRAAQAPLVKKALRVAIVSGSRIIEERVFRDGRLEAPFERVRGLVWLDVPSGVTGRIITAEGARDLGPHAERVALDESSRGKVVLAGTTYLFQFVVPPPRPARPQLPLTTRATPIDWALTIIAAFSFLLHFGVIGSMYSDWLDPIASNDDAVVSVIDLTHSLPSPVVEDPQTQTQTPTQTPTQTQTPTPTRTRSQTESADAHAASIAATAEAMRMSLLMSFTGTTAVDGALRRSDIELVNLDEAARDRRGAHNTSGDLHLAVNDGVTTPGTHGLNTLGHTQVDASHVQTHEVAGPKLDVSIPHIPPPPTIPNIDVSIARLRPSFRSCYQRGVAIDPTLQGKMTIEIAIAPNGDVADVTKVDGAGLSSTVEQCIITRAHNGTFDAPGTLTRVRVPVVFRLQTEN